MGGKKLVCGVGDNDLDEKVKVDGKNLKVYQCWRNLLTRCYSEKCQELRPTYKGCSVCEEWKYLSNFKKWFELNYKEGFQLDKDILKEENKVYSPEFCRFIPQYLNALLTDSAASRGNLPLGLSFQNDGRNKPYHAHCSNGFGNLINKCFSNLEDARAWYIATKKEIVRQQVCRALSEGAIDNEVAAALLSREF